MYINNTEECRILKFHFKIIFSLHLAYFLSVLNPNTSVLNEAKIQYCTESETGGMTPRAPTNPAQIRRKGKIEIDNLQEEEEVMKRAQ